MTFASTNFVSQGWEPMTDEEKTGIQLKTNSSFTWQQIRWAAVLIFCFISSGFQAKSWLTTYSIQQAANSTGIAVVNSSTEVEAIKKDLAKTNEKLERYGLALNSQLDFLIEEEPRQTSPQARKRFREQRLKIREILKPVSQTLPFANGYGRN